MLSKISLLLAKIEATYGTDPTPTGAANALLVRDLDIKEMDDVIERGTGYNFLDPYPSVKGGSWSEVSFKVDCCGSGTAGTAPRIGCLFQACGTDVTNTPATSDVYESKPTAGSSVTLYVQKDGRQHIVTGCVGNCKLTYTAGQPLVAEFTFQGRTATTTAAAIATPTFESTVKLPSICKSSTFSYDAKATLISKSVEFDFGNKIAKRADLNQASGIYGFQITEIMPKVTFTVECQIQTSFAFRADLMTTMRALVVAATRAAGNIFTLTVPALNVTKIEYGDEDGVLLEKIEGEATKSSGEDCFKITVT